MADPHPRRDQQRGGRQADDDRGAEVGLDDHQQAGERDDGQVGDEGADIRAICRPRGEEVGAVEDQRELRELRRLDLERAGADPALRAVADMPTPGTSTASRRKNEAARSSGVSGRTIWRPRSRQHAHHDQADRAEQQVRFR